MKKITVTEKFKDGTLAERITVTEETEFVMYEAEKPNTGSASTYGTTIDCSDYAKTGVTTAK